MAELLVLWDVDYTLVSADGLGTRLYEAVFREMFGRELGVIAPKAGRTDRAIAGDTLALAGVPRDEVGPFVATGSYPAADLAAAGAPVVLPDLTDTAGVVAAVTGPDLAGAAGRTERARGR